jgi:hypothetical protein
MNGDISRKTSLFLFSNLTITWFLVYHYKVYHLEFNSDFTVSPLPKRRHAQKRKVKPIFYKIEVMDQEKKFKNQTEIREYWRIHKQEQRSRQKTEKTSK